MPIKALLILSLGLMLVCFSPKSSAVECEITAAPVLNFGTVDPFTTTQQSSAVVLSWSCAPSTFGQALFGASATMCLYASAPAPGSITPRNLTPQPGPGSTIPFNIFTTAAATQILGQPGTPVNVGIPVNVAIPGFFGGNATGTVTVHGRIPAPLPGTTNAGTHVAQMFNSQVRVRTGGFNQSCTNVTPPITDNYTLTAQVDIADECDINATPLNFGTHTTPLTQTDAESTITVRCSATTDFTVALNDGLLGTREMSNGSYNLAYELYRNAGRTQRWGSIAAERQIGVGQGVGIGLPYSVFGRVFADAAAPPGSYLDTITATVEF